LLAVVRVQIEKRERVYNKYKKLVLCTGFKKKIILATDIE